MPFAALRLFFFELMNIQNEILNKNLLKPTSQLPAVCIASFSNIFSQEIATTATPTTILPIETQMTSLSASIRAEIFVHTSVKITSY